MHAQLAMDFLFSPYSFPVHSYPKNENGTRMMGSKISTLLPIVII